MKKKNMRTGATIRRQNTGEGRKPKGKKVKGGRHAEHMELAMLKRNH